MNLYPWDVNRIVALVDQINKPNTSSALREQALDEIHSIYAAAEVRARIAEEAKGRETIEYHERGFTYTWTPDEYEQNPTRTEGE